MNCDRGNLQKLEEITTSMIVRAAGGNPHGNPSPPPGNGWNEWRRHVLAELTRLADCVESLDEKQETIRIKIGQLEVKSGVWGALAGCIPAAIVVVLWLLRNAK